MATSRLLPVVVIGPWRNCWVTAATLTPMPLFWPLAEPTALATASANSAREDLKPVVLALAMLWPITSRFLLAAFRPERPCWNPMVCSCDVFGWMVRGSRSEEHTSELQSHSDLVCRLLLEKKKKNIIEI